MDGPVNGPKLQYGRLIVLLILAKECLFVVSTKLRIWDDVAD
jgi:hypothetical protein